MLLEYVCICCSVCLCETRPRRSPFQLTDRRATHPNVSPAIDVASRRRVYMYAPYVVRAASMVRSPTTSRRMLSSRAAVAHAPDTYGCVCAPTHTQCAQLSEVVVALRYRSFVRAVVFALFSARRTSALRRRIVVTHTSNHPGTKYHNTNLVEQ